MDWANIREVLARAREELDEVEQALDRNDTIHAAEELGDLNARDRQRSPLHRQRRRNDAARPPATSSSRD